MKLSIYLVTFTVIAFQLVFTLALQCDCNLEDHTCISQCINNCVASCEQDPKCLLDCAAGSASSVFPSSATPTGSATATATASASESDVSLPIISSVTSTPSGLPSSASSSLVESATSAVPSVPSESASASSQSSVPTDAVVDEGTAEFLRIPAFISMLVAVAGAMTLFF